jgi:hypothetical protein
MSQNWHLKKAIVTPPGFMSTFSAMPGERNNNTGLPDIPVDTDLKIEEKILDESIEDKLRKSGL